MTQMNADKGRMGRAESALSLGFIRKHLRHLRITVSLPFIVSLWFTLFPLLAAGCARGGATTPAEAGRRPVTLTIWSSPTGVEERAFERLLRWYEAGHPGVRIRNRGATQEDQVTRAIVAGVPPDLCYIYGTAVVGPLAAQGAMRSLDAYFAESGLRRADYLPTALEQGSYDGRLFAMPVTRDTMAFYWNRAIFREAGLDPDRPPRTLEELRQYAVRLTHRDTSGRLTRLGFPPPTIPGLLAALMGGRLYDERTRRLTADDPANARALRWLVETLRAQADLPAVRRFLTGFGQAEGSFNPFFSGRVAMCIDGEWLLLHIDKFAPQLDYGVAELPYPADRPALRNTAWQAGDVMFIPTGSRHPREAWDLITWLHGPRPQEWYAGQMTNLPCIRSLLNSRALTTGSKRQRQFGFILRRIATSPNTRYFPSLPISRRYEDELRTAEEYAGGGTKSPEQALADVQHRLEREWATVASSLAD
jgi:multiple sugar transport system substrate-binding protein